MNDARPNLAILSNEPTPYRLHVHNRIARELTGLRLHSLFMDRPGSLSAPWRVSLNPDIGPVFFEANGWRRDRPSRWREIRLYHDIRRWLVEHDVKLIVLLGWGDLTRLLLVRWAHRAGVPLLVNGDSNGLTEHRVTGVKRFVKRRVVRSVVGRAAGLMPMGQAGRRFFELYAPGHGKPEFLFPYEPDYAALQRREPDAEKSFRGQHGLADGRRRLLYCGRLVEHKGVHTLIDAFAAVASERPGWDLVIAGDGPQRQALLGRVPEALRGRVRWLGFLQFDDTRRAYHACDVLVHPSVYEPWGLVINEAVACGLAVVATDVTGAAVELVRPGVNGLLVPPGDAAALAGALRRVTEPAGCDAMRAAAAGVLADWRGRGDPVEGLRRAVGHFGLAGGQSAVKPAPGMTDKL